MDTEEEEVETEERKPASQPRHFSSTKTKLTRRQIFRLAFLFVVITFVAAFIGVVTKHDFIPFFTEHARELSKHRTRGERVEFNSVQNLEKFPHRDLRLPSDLKPVSYRLDLRVNLTTQRFRGKVKIKTLCRNSTRFFILHSGDLDITNVFVTKVEKGQEEKMAVERILAYKKHQQLCIELTEPLQKGEVYFATLEFKSKISNRLEGFYRSTYTTNGGEKRSVAVTHFEPAHARKAFPCFDEPSFKASFTVSIIHDPQYYALSNMPRARLVTRDDGLVEEHFAASVNMSSYLVAFAILDFKYREMKTDSGVLVRVHAPPDDYDRLDHALRTGVEVLSYYEKLFGEPFPLPKLDLLAVPDFLIGAMEEWGLVMFRRAYLVFDERFSSTDSKLKNTKVIAHELAHQWFGNLVTMNWWNDVWLNEGFAMFIEDDFGSYHVTKGWDMRELVVPGSWQSALQADSLWNSHPISVPVHSPEEIDDIFDSISYQKGGMILRMLMNFLGENNFLNGIKRYIQDYKYGNADAKELWDAIGQANGNLNVVEMMSVWTNQNGFPIVNINKRGNVLYVEQKDALKLLNKAAQRFSKRERWFIPLSYVTESQRLPKWVSISPNDKSYPLMGTTSNGWIMANVNATGFFMVNYDSDNWEKLAAQLAQDHEVFSPSDRAVLIHDVFTLSCAGLLDPLLALNLSKYLVREQHPVPWAVMRKVSKCLSWVLEKPYKLLYKKLLWHLQDHLINLLGIEDTGTDQDRYFRYSVLSEALKNGQRKDISSKFTGLFKKLKKTSLGSMPRLGPNFRYLAFSFGANKSNEEDWDFLWSVYQNSPFDADRKFLMNILTSFNTDNIRNRNLAYSLDETKVRPQDSLYWLEVIDKGHGKSDARWDFIIKHWKRLTTRYDGSYKLGNLIKSVAGSFRTKNQLKEVKTFFNSLTRGEIADRAQNQTLEKIHRNMAGKAPQLKTNVRRINAWLKDYFKTVNRKLSSSKRSKKLVK